MNKTILENMDKIISYFNLNLSEYTRYYIGPCPIHGGDNPTAFNLYHSGETNVGNWYCRTHKCHEHFNNINSIGFIQALLSVKKNKWSKPNDKVVSLPETIIWCENFFNVKYEPTDINLKKDISYSINRLCKNKKRIYDLFLSEEQYNNCDLKTDDYFISRGYALETINKFNIKYCDNPSKPMYCRSIVPLHDHTGKNIIGCSGRAVWDKCDICSSYHNPKRMCPPKEKLGIYCKWKNSRGFPGKYELFNFHRARKAIEKTGIVFLTEGQPNVFRLFEAGFEQSLGCFGSNFSIEQKKILDISMAHTIIIVPDADKASLKFIESIKKICKNSYNIVTIEPSYHDDIGQCNIETVKYLLLPFVEKYTRTL